MRKSLNSYRHAVFQWSRTKNIRDLLLLFSFRKYFQRRRPANTCAQHQIKKKIKKISDSFTNKFCFMDWFVPESALLFSHPDGDSKTNVRTRISKARRIFVAREISSRVDRATKPRSDFQHSRVLSLTVGRQEPPEDQRKAG